MTAAEIEAMYRLLAIAKYEDRYVIPAAHAESAAALEETASGCSLDVDGGPGMGGGGRFGSSSGRPVRAAVETFHALRNRQTADNAAGPSQPEPGQPAQLGRQRRTTRAVPAGTGPGRLRRGTGGPRMSRRRTGTGRPPSLPFLEPVVAHPIERVVAHMSASLLLEYPTSSCATSSPCCATRRGPVRRRRSSVRPVPRCGRGAGPRRPAGALRGDVRPAPPVRPVPELLRRRRHPAARHGPGDLRRGLPRVRLGPADDELPDHLPTVLELSARDPGPVADTLLGTHRAGIELLRSALHHVGSPYAHVVDAVCLTLPAVDERDRRPVRRPGRQRAAERDRRPVRTPAPLPDRPLGGAGMTTRDILLWVVLPYIAGAVFVVGHLWRYRYDRFGWTTRSSQVYESRLLRAGSPMFHVGILMVIGGHVVGLLIPRDVARGRRRHRARVPPGRDLGGHDRRGPHPRRARRSSSTAAGPSDPSSSRRRAWTSSCTSCWAPPWRSARRRR